MIRSVIAGGAEALGIALPDGAARLYESFIAALIDKNRDFNLTAIDTPEEAARLHILDSLAVLKSADISGKNVIDVGTGGGLPGVALKIAAPDANVTLLDATEKKIAFLDELTRTLGIPCTCVAGRAEELGREDMFRERYDLAVSRAVARLPVLCELCLPLVRVGGSFLAMKAADSDPEISDAKTAAASLGGRIERIDSTAIPGTGIIRRVVVIEKVSPTPEKYPRRWAAMQKRPL